MPVKISGTNRGESQKSTEIDNTAIIILGVVFIAVISVIAFVVISFINSSRCPDILTPAGSYISNCVTPIPATSAPIVGNTPAVATITPLPTSTAIPTPTSIPRPTPTSIPRPTPTPSLPPEPTLVPVERLEQQETGTSVTETYTRVLTANQVIIGEAHDGTFPSGHWNCSSFLIRGPGSKTFTIRDGAWALFSGLTSQDAINAQLSINVNHVYLSCGSKNIVEYK